MIQYIENAKRFGELSGPEKVELMIVAGSIPIMIIGLALLAFTDQLLIAGVFIGVGILDFAVLSQVIPNLMKKNAETESEPDSL